MELFNLMGVGVAVLLAGFFTLSVMGLAAVVLFWKTRRILVPQITLLLVTGLEVPIKRLGRIIRVDGSFVDRMVSHMRNLLNSGSYSKVPYHSRAVFMPQCLRHPDCPARLGSEGLECVNCGLCGLGEIKREAESEDMMFFIAPGGSLIKRMVSKYRPQAVLGVGCSMEIKEGTAAMEAASIPTQGVSLLRDGCIDTRINVSKVLDVMFMTSDPSKEHIISEERHAEISKKWSEKEEPSVELIDPQKF